MAQDLINHWWLFNLLAFVIAVRFFIRKVDHVVEAALIVIGIATVGLSLHYLPAMYSWIVAAVIGILFVCKPTRQNESLLEENLWAMAGTFMVICGIIIRTSAY